MSVRDYIICTEVSFYTCLMAKVYHFTAVFRVSNTHIRYSDMRSLALCRIAKKWVHPRLERGASRNVLGKP
jgi:hypothetical protein